MRHVVDRWVKFFWLRHRRELEVWLYTYGPMNRWKTVRDENDESGVWERKSW